ncbi:hypothetical protein PR003_g15232 [Phytophthora rubi]|uniref:Uncharacterized protein n=1 Tax=Phytophthora rubi TaxID=129364 RepID=A0A6A3KST4_9STRA|nr:hypothetical protein PR002_g15946 [Phytophthora rubi]KAE9020731.1 hypothetical protein PR001_g13531 [Phytophthora rubi]KAE9330782.1 hypothetical protein PR003_g15232 [Phytophthora rubi]
MAPKFVLLAVKTVLQQQAGADVLKHVAPLISSFCGPSAYLSLSRACSLYGSIPLLDWYWGSTVTTAVVEPPSLSFDDYMDTKPLDGDSRIIEAYKDGVFDKAAVKKVLAFWKESYSERLEFETKWCLAHFLRSDPHYYHWQFAESVKVAAERGDLTMTQWLMQHFPDCEVVVEVVLLAVQQGHLQILQYLFEQGGDSRVIHWGPCSIKEALRLNHIAVARWLIENVPQTYDANEADSLVKAALRNGDVELAGRLVPVGRTLQNYPPNGDDSVDWTADLEALRGNENRATRGVQELAKTGDLHSMKQIVELFSPIPIDSMTWLSCWNFALTSACESGQLETLQWLIDHPLGAKVCKTMRSDGELFRLVVGAATHGHMDIMQFLFERGAIDDYCSPMVLAIKNCQLAAVKWLAERMPRDEEMPNLCLLREAAKGGHLEILQYFQTLGLPGFSSASPETKEATNDQWKLNFRNDRCARLQWITSERVKWRSTDAMNDAAANGHLEVVKWLHFNRSEGCTTAAMDKAACRDHIDVVKWLHANRSEGCTTKAMDKAAANGNLEVVKWLHANRSEGCTVVAIEGALSNGHLGVARWLRSHFPELEPKDVDPPTNSFDALLFLYIYYPNILSRVFRDEALASLESYSESHDVHIVQWLQKKYPAWK